MALPTSRPARDGLWALLLTLATQVELLLAADRLSLPLAQHVTFVLVTAPVTVRRQAPLTATLVCALGMALQTLAGPAPVVGGFIAVLVVVGSLGFHADLRRGLSGLVAMGAAVSLADVVAEQFSTADLLGNMAIVLMAWGFAHVTRVSTDARIAAEIARDRAARDAVVAERARIARDLHDSVAHVLTMMTLQAGAARERAGEEVAVTALSAIETGGREALTDMHRFLRLLGDEADPGEAPGLQHLDDLIGRVRAGGFEVDLDTAGDLAGVPASVSSTAYRVVQEGLTNAAKHSGSRGAKVRVAHRDGLVQVGVSDTGTAAGAGRRMTIGSGRGLTALRQRLELFHGTMTTGGDDEGWSLTATIPVGTDR